MKIKVRNKAYSYVAALPRQTRQRPARPMWLLGFVIRVISVFDLWAVKFTYRKIGMDKLGKKEPCLVLMNHSSFIDLVFVGNLLADIMYFFVDPRIRENENLEIAISIKYLSEDTTETANLKIGVWFNL